MRNIRMLVVAGVTVAGGVVLAAGNAAYPERWAFWHGHIETLQECSGFSNVVDQAVRDGCTAMLIGDGVDYYSCWGNHHRQTLAAALAYCRAKGLQIVTCVWSIGYGAMLNYGYELMEGVPLDNLEYVVGKDRRARFRPSQTENLVPNGGFEQAGPNGRVTGWTFIDGLGGKAP